jgi:penicillin-binding protein 2
VPVETVPAVRSPGSGSVGGFGRRFRLRVWRLALVLAAAWLALIVRLAYLQLYQGNDLLRQALENSTRLQSLPAHRGSIYDRQGRPLALNRPELRVSWQIRELQHPRATLEKLASILQEPDLFARPGQTQARRPFEPRLWARLGELRETEPHLQVELSARRYYPAGELACHVLGYLGDSSLATSQQDAVGKDGLEEYAEALLRGERGHRLEWVDATGAPRKILEAKPPTAGSDLYLTLDLDLQRAATTALQTTLDRIYQAIGERSAGAIVAIEPETGKIRALVSLPGYQPNWFLDARYARQVRSLLSDPRAPLFNRAISGLYAPASTFKLITSSAAFASHLIAQNVLFHCTGVFMVGDIPFHCFVRTGHGTITYEQAIAESCDVVFYELGVQLGVKRMKEWALRFGLGVKTGIELPGEADGLVPDSAYKERLTHGKMRWYAGDDANMGIGQGYLLVTPLQMAMVAATIANGGRLLQPTLLEKVVGPDGTSSNEDRFRHRVPIAPADLARIQAGMQGSVRYGTAARAYRADLVLAGKTGTVENTPSTDNPRGLNHTWFIGYGPSNARERHHSGLAVAVFLERSGGYGGALAAPLATYVVQTWMNSP